MKKLLLITILAGLLASCSYDDSAILDRLAKIEKEQKQMQDQIEAQQTLINALVKNLTITAVSETAEGYVVLFSDGSTITLKHGENGKPGTNGVDGDSFIESIVVGEDVVTFVLVDGDSVVIPLNKELRFENDNNKIYYTTSDGKKLFPRESDGKTFGAILVSNTYEDGVGCLVFNDVVTSIGSDAYRFCGTLATITIPESVSSIGAYSFNECKQLHTVYCKAKIPPLGADGMFYINASDRKIYVPTESVAAYKASSYWSAYKGGIEGYEF